MKCLLNRWLAWGQAAAVVALALLALPISQAAAQGKPVLVLSLSSVEETLADVGYITRAAGAEDAGRTAILLGNAFTSGIDKKRPIGMYVVPADGDFQAVAFAPVKDLKVVLETFKEQLGEPKDAGDGVLEVGTDQTVYIKEVQGWAFVAQSKEHLTKLPADPAAMLGQLPAQYNVAVRVLSQNFPQELKQLAIDEMKVGFERGLDTGLGNGEVDPEVAKNLGRNMIADLEELIAESDELMIGLAIDAAAKKTYLDLTLTAVEGSKLAGKMASLQNTKSAFGGFQLPGSSLSMNVSSLMTKDDIEQMQLMVKQMRAEAMKEIDNDPDLAADKRDAAKQILGRFVDVLDKTLAGGRLDGGAVLMLEPKSIAFASGMLVADGQSLDRAFKDLVALAKDEPDFPQVKLNAGSHAGVTFHKLIAPVPESEAEVRELFGETIDIVIGISGKSAYLAFGKNCEGLLKQVIDQSASAADRVVAPFQLNVSLLPILKFADSVDDNPIVPSLIETLEKAGNDRISLTAKPIPRGAHYRLEVEDGVLKVIGEAVKRFGGDLQSGL